MYVDFLCFPVHCEILEAGTLSLCIYLCCPAECPEGDSEPSRLRGVVRLFLTANDLALLVSNVVFQELVAAAAALQVSVATVMGPAAPVTRLRSWGCLPRLQGAQGSSALRPVLWAETPGHWCSLEQNAQQSGCFFIQEFLGFCANGVTGAFQLPAAPGRQVGRGQGGLGPASPISCILGGSSATHTTVAAIEAITGQS